MSKEPINPWAEISRLRASLAAAEAKLADEERHADELADHMQSLQDAGYEFHSPDNCERVDALLAAHAARRAHDSECESEFDSQVYAQTPCGCATRRAARDGDKEAR